MSEILFRGIREDSGKWVYGDLIHANDGTPHISVPMIALPYKVIPETVSQYTGQKDKNGKKIFEGDIATTNSGLIWIVLWNQELARFELKYKDKSSDACGMRQEWILNTNFKVIGNLYENSELLKGGEE